MARIDTRRGNPQPYAPSQPPAPGSTPEQITRAVWDELNRLAAYLAQTAPTPATTNEGNHP